jgi:hypothetical protein
MPEDDQKVETGTYRMSGGDAGLTVQRSQASWNYLYVILGFALAIESNIISMSTPPVVFPYNLIIFALASLVTIRAILFNELVQNWLLEVKAQYEKGRPN